MPKTLNIAVIGAGTMAQAVHLPVLRRRWDRFAVAALVDHSARRRRESSEVWGIPEKKRFETVADLIAAVRAKEVELDAALLSTDGLHVEDLLQLLRRGIPVLVEPPLGFSAEEISRVADFERMTGRSLLMMAYPQQHDPSVGRIAEQIAVKDVRMIDYEVLMPASQPLFGGAHVTTSAYDLPSEKRSARRTALQEAVVAGAGDGATQRDRDLYVKGLLTGVAHQLAVIERVYGPVTEVRAVRHWPKGVIPGSIELLGELGGGGQVRVVWHYLPFAPEYSEKLQILSARRRMNLELFAPSHGDRRSTISLREKKSGVITESSTVANVGSAEAMWEAFHAFVEKGKGPVFGSAQELEQVTVLRQVLTAIVEGEGRSLEAEPEPAPEEAPVQEAAPEQESAAESEEGPALESAPEPEPEPASESATDEERTEDEGRTAVDGPSAGGDELPEPTNPTTPIDAWNLEEADGTATGDPADGRDAAQADEQQASRS